MSWLKIPNAHQRVFLALILFNNEDLLQLLQYKEIVKQLSAKEVLMLQNRSDKIAQILLKTTQHVLSQAQLLQIAQTHAEIWTDNNFIIALTGESLVTCAFAEKKEILTELITAIYYNDTLYGRFLTSLKKTENHIKIASLCLKVPEELRQKLLDDNELITIMAENPYGEPFAALYKLLEQQKNDTGPINQLQQKLKRLWNKGEIKERLIVETNPEILRYLITCLNDNEFASQKSDILKILTNADDYPFNLILPMFMAELSKALSEETATVFSSRFYSLFFENKTLRNKLIAQAHPNDIAHFVIVANEQQKSDFYLACCDALTSGQNIHEVSTENQVELCLFEEKLRKLILIDSDRRHEIITTTKLAKLKALLELENSLALEIAKLYITTRKVRQFYLGIEPLTTGKTAAEFQETLIEILEKLKKPGRNNSNLETLIAGVKRFETKALDEVSKKSAVSPKKSESSSNKNFVIIKGWLNQSQDPNVRPSLRKLAQERKYRIAENAIRLLKNDFDTFENYSDNELLEIIQLPGFVHQLSTSQIVELQRRSVQIAQFLLHPVCHKATHLIDFLRHPIHKLTQEQLLEIATTRPEAWTLYAFSRQLPFLSRSWVGQTRLGRAFRGRSYRDELSGESLTKCIFVDDQKVRTAAIKVIAEDKTLTERLLKSSTLFKDNTKFLRFFAEAPESLQQKLLTLSALPEFLSGLLKDSAKLSLFFAEAPETLQQKLLTLPSFLSHDKILQSFVTSISIELQNEKRKSKIKEALQALWKNASDEQKTKLLTKATPIVLSALWEIAEVAAELKNKKLRDEFNKNFANLKQGDYPFNLVLPQLHELFISSPTDLKNFFNLYQLFFSQPSLREKIINASTAESVIKFLFAINKRIQTLSASLNDEDQKQFKQLMEQLIQLKNLFYGGSNYFEPNVFKAQKSQIDKTLKSLSNKHSSPRDIVFLESQKSRLEKAISEYDTNKSGTPAATLLLSENKTIADYDIADLLKIMFFLPQLQFVSLNDNWQKKVVDLAEQFSINSNVRKKLLGIEPQENPEITKGFLFTLLDMLNRIATENPSEKEVIEKLIKQMKQADHFNSEITMGGVYVEWQRKNGSPLTLTPREFLCLSASEQGSLVKEKQILIDLFIKTNALEAELLISSQGNSLADLLVEIITSDESSNEEIKNALLSKLEHNNNLYRQILVRNSIRLNILFVQSLEIRKFISQNESLYLKMLQDESALNNIANLYLAAKNDLLIRKAIIDDDRLLEALLMGTHPNVLTTLLIEETKPDLKNTLLARLETLYLTTEYMCYLVNTHLNLLILLFDNISEEQREAYNIKVIKTLAPRQLIELCLQGSKEKVSHLINTLKQEAYTPQRRSMLDDGYEQAKVRSLLEPNVIYNNADGPRWMTHFQPTTTYTTLNPSDYLTPSHTDTSLPEKQVCILN